MRMHQLVDLDLVVNQIKNRRLPSRRKERWHQLWKQLTRSPSMFQYQVQQKGKRTLTSRRTSWNR